MIAPSSQPSDQEQIQKLLTKAKTHALLIAGIFAGVVGLFLFFALSPHNTPDNTEYKKEIKTLQADLKKLNEQYVKDSVNYNNLKDTLNVAMKERDVLTTNIKHLGQSLSQIQKQYEKISNYRNIPADSLGRIFSDRFNY